MLVRKILGSFSSKHEYDFLMKHIIIKLCCEVFIIYFLFLKRFAKFTILGESDKAHAVHTLIEIIILNENIYKKENIVIRIN